MVSDSLQFYSQDLDIIIIKLKKIYNWLCPSTKLKALDYSN